MKIDFQSVITNLEGAAIQDGGKDLTLKDVAVQALLSLSQDDKDVSGEEKYKRFKLADRIYRSNGDGADLKAEEVATLKTVIARIYLPMVVGRAFDLLDG